VPVPFPQWNGLLDEIAGRAGEPGRAEDPSPDVDHAAARLEWAAEADSLARLLAGELPADFERRLKLAMARWPNEIRFQLLQSDLLARSGDREGAEHALRTLCERHPRNPWPRVRLTQLLAGAGRLSDARALFDRELRGAAIPDALKQRLLAALAPDRDDAVPLG
jgi:predicted Zn-dependent protease